LKSANHAFGATGHDAGALSLADRLVGQLFETMVVPEILPHLQASSMQTRLFHARSTNDKDVDLVLELRPISTLWTT